MEIMRHGKTHFFVLCWSCGVTGPRRMYVAFAVSAFLRDGEKVNARRRAA
jgi:hypothetical protein